MSPDKKAQINKQVKRLHTALTGEKYILGYIYSGNEDGEGRAMLHVNVRNETELKELAIFMHNAAKQNQVFAALLDYVRAIQESEKKAAEPKKRSGLILPKLKLR